MDGLTNKIAMWRNELEKQNANMGVMSVFDSIMSFVGEQQRENELLKNRHIHHDGTIKGLGTHTNKYGY